MFDGAQHAAQEHVFKLGRNDGLPVRRPGYVLVLLAHVAPRDARAAFSDTLPPHLADFAIVDCA